MLIWITSSSMYTMILEMSFNTVLMSKAKLLYSKLKQILFKIEFIIISSKDEEKEHYIKKELIKAQLVDKILDYLGR